MGTKMGPSYANLFVGQQIIQIIQQIFERYTGPIPDFLADTLMTAWEQYHVHVWI